ncbi:hypothetical protein [Desulfosporosinus sp. OT]|uniref:hypothetical protein n=1 Tax=Desulfosporosinus sp. OT TaxID=913865 RepID=UPI000223B239|nr:hypothetical protein [Desulfosporosinus sp. OT]EGW38793.1 putative lipoprotein [Desulfosporosinus sp. OT]
MNKSIIFLLVFLLIVLSGCQDTRKTLQELNNKQVAFGAPENEDGKYEMNASNEDTVLSQANEIKEEKEFQSIWIVNAYGDKKLIKTFSEGLWYEYPRMSPDLNKIMIGKGNFLK